MMRATITGIAVAAVLGAGALTALTIPGLTNAQQPVGTGQGSVPMRMHSAAIPGVPSHMGMMTFGGGKWMGGPMHNGMMGGWSR